MYVSVSHNSLFSKKRRFPYISPTEQDILGMIEITLWKPVLLLQI